jgi:hypothetical protein
MISRLTLQPRRWYGWSVLGIETPGPPWNASPIFVTAITPLKSGKGKLRLEGIAALRPDGPVAFEALLTVDHRLSDLLIGQWEEQEYKSTFSISDIDEMWIEQNCPALFAAMKMHTYWHGHPDDPQAAGLDAYFGSDAISILRAPQSRWRTAPQPIDARFARAFVCEASYGHLDAMLIRRGYTAYEMEQKWNIHIHSDERGGTVVFSRSWTGFVAYHWPFTATESGIQFKRAVLNADRSMVNYGTPAHEAEQLLEAFEGYLLGRQHAGRWTTTLAKLPVQTVEAAWRREEQHLH